MVTLSAAQRRVLEHLLDEAASFLEAGELARARVCLAEAVQIDAEAAEVAVMQAELALADGRDDDAIGQLRRALQGSPTHADAHYLLGALLGERDDFDGMVSHWLEVLRLDAAADRKQAIGLPEQLAMVEDQAQEVLAALPEPFASRMAEVPVMLEARPHEGIVAEGFDPRAVGMFEGPDDAGSHMLGMGGPALRPTRIVVFYANLLAGCGSREELEEQLEITLLHEIGHFFGLDEEQVAALGLE